MKNLLLLTFLLKISLYLQSQAQQITDIVWQDKPHFKIVTQTATYLYDKAGGGISSIFDVESNDWVSFKEIGNDEYPASAAGRFRGMPNCVFGTPDKGAGHPGFKQCESKKVSDTEIVSTSKSGLWQWRWQFSDVHAKFIMEKVAPDHGYWFLYEGTPGGSYQPKKSYWGTNTLEPSYSIPNHYENDKTVGNWDWVFFGRDDVSRVFFIKMLMPDQHPDVFAYLGNDEKKGVGSDDGMTVFGFGRDKGIIPFMTKNDNTFVIGFYPKSIKSTKDYKKFKKFLKKVN